MHLSPRDGFRRDDGDRQLSTTRAVRARVAAVPRTLRLRPPYTKPSADGSDDGGGGGRRNAGGAGGAAPAPEREVVLSNSRPHGLQLSRDLVADVVGKLASRRGAAARRAWRV